MNLKKIVLTAAAVTVSVGLIAPTAQAGQTWNDYTTTLPALVTGRTDFTVNIDGPTAVCSMKFGNKTLTAAPWTFTFDPTDINSNHVSITECDGQSDWVGIQARVPYTLDNNMLTVSNADQTITVQNRTDAPATAVLRNEQGAALTQVRVEANSTAAMTVNLKSLKRSAIYSVAITGDNGITQSIPVYAAKGYATFDFLGSTPNFTPCSTVTWSYDATNQQGKAKTLKADIQPALDRIAKETGLTFVYTADYKNADLRYHWGSAMGAAATGGTDGDIEISTTNYWPTDKYAGFAAFKPYTKGNMRYLSGPSGRGWLLVHETLHSLGFDHVENQKSVMAPINRGQHGFDQGDLDGMHAIYLSKCAA